MRPCLTPSSLRLTESTLLSVSTETFLRAAAQAGFREVGTAFYPGLGSA